MLVLGIESSCDETAAAVLEDGRIIRSSIVASQDDVHARFGGVVPELASRSHIRNILPVLDAALHDAGIGMRDISGIAVTRGPGLIGPLLVGLSAGKALAYAHGIPFVGVHHIEGHLAAALLADQTPSFPLVGLVASGGHTSLFRMEAPGAFRLLAQSRDDAAGEAFDKTAKLCGLPFPGGPAIDAASTGGNPEAIKFTRPGRLLTDFSFSGLKTAVALWVRDHGIPKDSGLADLAASIQEAIVDVLIEKLIATAKREHVSTVAVCGGVAKNRRFRQRLEAELVTHDLRLLLAPMNLCTDNAAMIAAAGAPRLMRGESDSLSLNAIATLPLAS